MKKACKPYHRVAQNGLANARMGNVKFRSFMTKDRKNATAIHEKAHAQGISSHVGLLI